MYAPQLHVETRTDVMHALIRAYPLGAWVVVDDQTLIANHIPFLVDSTRGEFGTLVGHVARANPVWTLAQSSIPSLVSFHGPQSYITPSWYPSKHEHGKAVPTWNYAVVHAHGQPRFIQERQWLVEHVAKLTDTHEGGQALPWRVADAPVDFTERLIGAIVGVEIPVMRLEGKWKTHQNRATPDKLGVVAGLLSRGDDEAVEMAGLVQQHVKPLRGD
jgi:transcriptional regulator